MFSWYIFLKITRNGGYSKSTSLRKEWGKFDGITDKTSHEQKVEPKKLFRSAKSFSSLLSARRFFLLSYPMGDVRLWVRECVSVYLCVCVSDIFYLKNQNNLLITLLFHSLSLFSEWYGGRRRTKKLKIPPKNSFCQWYDVWVAPKRQLK